MLFALDIVADEFPFQDTLEAECASWMMARREEEKKEDEKKGTQGSLDKSGDFLLDSCSAKQRGVNR